MRTVRILLNGLIQPFQQPERVVGFFNTYRQLYPVSRHVLRDIAEQFEATLKSLPNHFSCDTDCKILADDPELAGNPVFSFRIHVTGEKLLAAINQVDALAEWLEPHLKAEKWRR